jgi:hypothetical protein
MQGRPIGSSTSCPTACGSSCASRPYRDLRDISVPRLRGGFCWRDDAEKPQRRFAYARMGRVAAQTYGYNPSRGG